MKLAYGIVADAAQMAPDGKFSALGADFDTIYALSFPVQHPSLALIIRLDVELSECEHEHRFRLTLHGPFGTIEIPSVTASFTPHKPPEYRGQPIRQTFVLNLNGLLFQQPGKYRFRTEVDGRQMGDIPLYLAHLPQSSVGVIN